MTEQQRIRASDAAVSQGRTAGWGEADAGAETLSEMERKLRESEDALAATRRQRMWLSIGLAIVAFLLLSGAIGTWVWAQRQEARLAGEQARIAEEKSRLEAEHAARGKFVNQEIEASLREGQLTLKDLQKQLADPLTTAKLLSAMNDWQMQLKTAELAVQRARKLAEAESGLVTEETRIHVNDAAEELHAAVKAHQLAHELDMLHQNATMPGAGLLKNAEPGFDKIFGKLGIDVLAAPAEASAGAVGKSPLRFVLVGILDHWAGLTRNADLRPRLLRLSQLADPNPWREDVRDPKNSKDLPRLRQLAEGAKPHQQPPQTLALLAAKLRSAGATKDAVGLLQRALVEYPHDFWLYLELGRLTDRAAERVGYFQAALVLRPDSAAAFANLGQALRANKDLDGALACCLKGVALAPKNALAHNSLGQVFFDRKELKPAIAEFEDAIDINSKIAAIHANLGMARYENKNLKAALESFQTALALDPSDAAVHTSMGNIFRDQNKLDAAIAAYKKATSANPDYAPAHLRLGDALRIKNDLDGAITAYQAGLGLDPNDAPAQNHLGQALFAKKKVDAAVAAYKKAIALAPEEPSAHYNLGIALRARHDLAGAITEFQTTTVLSPKDASAQYGLGLSLYESKSLDAAIVALKKAVNLDPKHLQAEVHLGYALLDKRQLDDAIKYLEKVVKTDPSLTKARGALGQALMLQGRFSEAKQATLQALGQVKPDMAYHDVLQDQLVLCEKLLAVDQRLTAVTDGKAKAKDAGEHLAFAELCRKYKHQYAAAANYYAAAFAAAPKLATDLTTGYRFAAARAAALAGAGQGKDVQKFDAKAKAVMRDQALEWLQADLKAWQHALTSKDAEPGTAEAIIKKLAQWQTEPDLAGVREPAALAQLSEDERPSWQKLWAEVAVLVQQAKKQLP